VSNNTHISVLPPEEDTLVELPSNLRDTDDFVEIVVRVNIVELVACRAVVVILKQGRNSLDRAKHENGVEVHVLKSFRVGCHPVDEALEVRFPFARCLVEPFVADVD